MLGLMPAMFAEDPGATLNTTTSAFVVRYGAQHGPEEQREGDDGD